MKVKFLGKDLHTDAPLPVGLQARVERMAWAALGGPIEAELLVDGLDKHMLELRDFLRYGVEIYDDHGEAIWWGFVDRVEVPKGNTTLVLDLGQVFNQVAIAYTLVATGNETQGVRATTSWQADATSIDRYGYKELLYTGSDLSVEAALLLAKRKVQELAYPPEIALIKQGSRSAKLHLSGYWSTLAWRYAYVSTHQALSFETIGKENRVLGGGAKLAQSFDTSTAFGLREIAVYLRRVGTPGGLTISIHENVANVDREPGTQLASAVVDESAVNEAYGFVKATLATTLQLQPGASYWLQVSCNSGDASNYYEFALDPAQGYKAGVLVASSGSGWSAVGSDMPFKLYSDLPVQTSQQVQNLITSYGQFLEHVRIPVGSGVITESFRSGDTLAISEIEAHLETGTSDYKRMLAWVNKDRSVDITVQGEPTAATIQIRDDGVLYFQTGGKIDLPYRAAGKWIDTRPISHSANSSSATAQMQAMFCERIEMDADGGYELIPANYYNPNAVRVLDG